MDIKESLQKEGFVYDKVSGEIGAIGGVSFRNNTVELLLDNCEVTEVYATDAVFLEKVGYIGRTGIINHDVLEATDHDSLYEIVLREDGQGFRLFKLNNKLERANYGITYSLDELSELEGLVKLVGNIYQLEVETVDFNIKIVRTSRNGEIEYHYACNNKEAEEIDLIKVIYMGSTLLEEENYKRVTISHDEYLEGVADGLFVEVTPQQLQNYVTGKLMGYGDEETGAMALLQEKRHGFCDNCVCEDPCEDLDEDELELDDIDEDICEDCGEYPEDCYCDL